MSAAELAATSAAEGVWSSWERLDLLANCAGISRTMSRSEELGEDVAAYVASKGGIEMLTRVLAAEWAGRNVRVNMSALGYVATPMTDGLRGSERWSRRITERVPMRRFPLPEELISSMLDLASDASSLVTATTVYVDGGWTAT